ncbi:RNA polymerase sigma factor [Butyricimonas sp. Marseille-P3923]|uniref:RNA polymerase sigma factor n=1 Tax=Butyricimonas sp. Marseille-P3923 TaxID=1987504 RepID=UPI0021004EDF|nr:RNA polymerase sigma-70 factor [Butyricimonas sp. Marseille-P3923]
MRIVSEEMLGPFKKGDGSAFRYYYEMYYDSLCLFGMRMLKEEEVALDIAQDVFVNLWKAREGIESELHLKMYVYQSMRHRCLNYIRVKRLEANYRDEYMMLTSEGEFVNAVVEEEVYRLVMQEIDALPHEQRRVLLMHLEGKNNIEIAEIMKVTVNTVKTHKARARQQLRIKLNDLFIISVILGI